LRWAVYLGHGLLVVALLIWPLPFGWWLLIPPFLVFSVCWQLNALKRHELVLLYQADKWLLLRPGKAMDQLELQPGSWISRFLIVLYFKQSVTGQAVAPVVLVADAVDSVAMRRLRVLLRFVLLRELGHL
jgi:hypothetical protein